MWWHHNVTWLTAGASHAALGFNLQPRSHAPPDFQIPSAAAMHEVSFFSDRAVRPHMPPASWRAASQHRCNVDVSSSSCLTEWQPGAEGGVGGSGPAAWTKSTCSFWSGCHNFSWALSLFSWKASPEADPQADSSPACATRPPCNGLTNLPSSDS